MGNDKRDAPAAYLVGSALAAVVNFPLWKASAMAQSGFKTKSRGYFAAYAEALRPPYRGVAAVVGGMTWARFAIFYGSDVGRAELEKTEAFRGTTAAVAPRTRLLPRLPGPGCPRRRWQWAPALLLSHRAVAPLLPASSRARATASSGARRRCRSRGCRGPLLRHQVCRRQTLGTRCGHWSLCGRTCGGTEIGGVRHGHACRRCANL